MSGTLHVVFVITRADDIGGAQVHVRDLAAALDQRGHRVTVVSGPPGVLSAQLQDRGIEFRSAPHLARPIGPVRDVRAFLEIRHILADLRPDLVSTHSSKAGVLGRIAARSLGLPVLFTAHGWSFGEGRPWPQRWLYQLIEWAASPFGSRIVTVSSADLELAASASVAPRERMVTVRNAMPDVAGDLLAEPGASPPGLVMVARFAPQKDHASVLRALATVRDREWTMTFVGEGPGEAATQRMARDLGLEDRIEFLGFRSDVPQLLARHQVFVLASAFEGLPRSILEAMRAGLPVIATDVGGVREALGDGSAGCLVAPRDVQALAHDLRRLIEDPGLRERMGREARRRYRDHFAFDRLVDETMAVYREVLDT